MRNHLNRFYQLQKATCTGILAATLALPGVQLHAATQQQPHLLGGSIGDGPAINTTVFLYDRNGGLIDKRTGNAFANYQLSIPAGVPYPVRIEAIRGTDLVTGMPLDFTLKATALTNTQPRSNLNPYSTLVVEMARTMTNGLTATNVATATAIAVREFNFGLRTASVPDPMRTAITTQNVANIVRASEALGEVVRRTQRALAQANYARTHDAIVLALAADLRDGRLDGRGATGTDVRISATANVVSAQVLIEGLMNRLYVNGTLATAAMDNAIRTVLPATTAFTNSVTVPVAMLTQTKRMLSAVRQFDTRTQLATLAGIVNQIPAESTTALVRTKLTDAHSRLLDVSVTNIARAPATTLQAVNAAVGSGTVLSAPASVNRAPTISGTPRTSITAGGAYSFVPTSSDADGNTLRFSIANKPAWATFNTATGALTGTPTAAGTFGSIVISVSDGSLSAALPAFTISVTTATTANRAPTLSGTPATGVTAGAFYSFAPTAIDQDGNSLSFSITNRPAWASFNTSTGRLSGTPTEANVGSYDNIVIRVSDGTVSTALPAFSIRVSSAQTSTPGFTLRWVAPSTRSDGSSIPLSQISGYRIRYGTAPGSYTRSASINDGGTSYTFQGLTAGTYYFVVTAVDSGGRESGYSNPVSTQVQ